jgi:hypothetical protein
MDVYVRQALVSIHLFAVLDVPLNFQGRESHWRLDN